MSRFPRLVLPAAIYVSGLALYGVFVALSGSDPHVARGSLLDAASLLAAWAIIVAVVIGSARLVREIDDAETVLETIRSAAVQHDLPKAA